MLYIFIISALFCFNNFISVTLYEQFDSLLTLYLILLNHCYIFGILNVYHNFIYIHKHKINILFLFKSMHFHLDHAFSYHVLTFHLSGVSLGILQVNMI